MDLKRWNNGTIKLSYSLLIGKIALESSIYASYVRLFNLKLEDSRGANEPQGYGFASVWEKNQRKRRYMYVGLYILPKFYNADSVLLSS